MAPLFPLPPSLLRSPSPRPRSRPAPLPSRALPPQRWPLPSELVSASYKSKGRAETGLANLSLRWSSHEIFAHQIASEAWRRVWRRVEEPRRGRLRRGRRGGGRRGGARQGGARGASASGWTARGPARGPSDASRPHHIHRPREATTSLQRRARPGGRKRERGRSRSSGSSGRCRASSSSWGCRR